MVSAVPVEQIEVQNQDDKSVGSVYSWGLDAMSQLGLKKPASKTGQRVVHGSKESREMLPKKLTGLKNITSVHGYSKFCAAIDKQG